LSDSPQKTRKGRSDEQNLELLNENHQLRLRVTFQHIDSLLTEVEQLCRIITTHGLIEYREALGFIIDRIENNVFEIGVFGRVSSGKSSLLNYLLGIDYLPVGNFNLR
jgi:predicted GTPase